MKRQLVIGDLDDWRLLMIGDCRLKELIERIEGTPDSSRGVHSVIDPQSANQFTQSMTRHSSTLFNRLNRLNRQSSLRLS